MKKILKLNRWTLLCIVFVVPGLWNFFIGYKNFAFDLAGFFMMCIFLVGWIFSMEKYVSQKYNLKKISAMVIAKYFFLLIYPLMFRLLVYPLTHISVQHSLFYYILPVHILFCLAYLNALIRVSHKLKISVFGDVGSLFWKLFFFPVGIYYLQPRLNKLFSERMDESLI